MYVWTIDVYYVGSFTSENFKQKNETEHKLEQHSESGKTTQFRSHTTYKSTTLNSTPYTIVINSVLSIDEGVKEHVGYVWNIIIWCVWNNNNLFWYP